MRWGSECPMKITNVVRGGSAFRWALSEASTGVSSSAVGGGLAIVDGGAAGWSTEALGITPKEEHINKQNT